jgi:RNA polymerase sigma-70 factor (ECF subfamily)
MEGVDTGRDAADLVLLQRMAGGDRAALGILYESYHGRLCRFLSRLTRRIDVIDEVINDTFWIAWQKAGDFRGDSRVSTWIKHGAEAAGEAPESDESTFAAHPDEHQELRDWLNKGLERLNPDQRVVIELVYGVGHSLEDVAAIMQCPVGTVKARLFHARVKLRNVLPDLAGEPRIYHLGVS